MTEGAGTPRREKAHTHADSGEIAKTGARVNKTHRSNADREMLNNKKIS